MKRLVLLLLVMGIAVTLFAQTLPVPQFASGSWSFGLDGRLYQNDANARLAKVNAQIPQNGAMEYVFNARYEGGAEDGHGGFGIHVFADTAFNGASWGVGRSYLFWLNYDENPIAGSGIPRGLSAQVYRSISNSQMVLEASIDMNEWMPLLLFVTQDLTRSLNIILKVYPNGEVRIYDPTGGDEYLYFFVEQPITQGGWVSLRTNGMKMSFGF